MQYETEVIESLVRAAKLLCAADYERRIKEIEELDAERLALCCIYAVGYVGSIVVHVPAYIQALSSLLGVLKRPATNCRPAAPTLS